MRVLCALAASGSVMTAGELADVEGLPTKFLESIPTDLRKAVLLVSKRGVDGGYQLARPAAELRLSDVVRPLVGPLAEVRGQEIDTTHYDGAARALPDVWGWRSGPTSATYWGRSPSRTSWPVTPRRRPGGPSTNPLPRRPPDTGVRPIDSRRAVRRLPTP